MIPHRIFEMNGKKRGLREELRFGAALESERDTRWFNMTMLSYDIGRLCHELTIDWQQVHRLEASWMTFVSVSLLIAVIRLCCFPPSSLYTVRRPLRSLDELDPRGHRVWLILEVLHW